MRAIGNPVAFDASADERDTRGFISITIISPSRGLIANWMLQPPASTPTSRMIATAASRIVWYSRSVSVIAGATVIESPTSQILVERSLIGWKEFELEVMRDRYD